MTARLLAFVIWAAVAATIVFWGLRLFATSPSAPPTVQAATTPTVARGDLTRLFGGSAQPASAPVAADSNRFRLVGVVAPRSGEPEHGGVALLSVDEKPARPFRVGAVVDDRWVVQSVFARGVNIGPKGADPALRLELPPPTAAATGSLPPPMPLSNPPAAGPATAPPPGAMPPATSPPGGAPSPAPAPSGPVPIQPQPQAPASPQQQPPPAPPAQEPATQ